MKTVSVIGLGYVGFPLAKLCAERGYKTFGIDLDLKRVEQTRGIPNLTGTTDGVKAIKQSDVVIVCVQTPLDEHKRPDYKPLVSATDTVAKGLKKNQLIVIESTVSPGAIETACLPILKQAGEDFNLAHCPERINPGDKVWSVKNIPRVVGGLNEASTNAAAEFYESILDKGVTVTRLSSIKAAEMVKIRENTFRDINIALANELAKFCSAVGIDYHEVEKAAATKPYSFIPHYPGPGVGGHCFDKNEWIFIKHENSVFPIKIGELYESLSFNETQVRDATIVAPKNMDVLAFDMNSKKSCYKPLKLLSKRAYPKLLKLKTAGGYSINVTDKHPVLAFNGNLCIKPASDLAKEDRLIISSELPEIEKELKIDILEHITDALAKKIRVKLRASKFSDYKKELKPFISEYPYHDDFFRYDELPLKYFLKAEKVLNIPREKIYLCTGRGPAVRKIPAILEIDKEFARLLGYYLSEGCLTEDKTLRIRFTFGQDEKEYISDLKEILTKKGLRFSEYIDAKNHSHHIKVSSELLGVVFRDILACGTNCYNMLIPPKLFTLPRQLRVELLKGILRGDAGVSYICKKRTYKKSGKVYAHNNTTASTDYFTSSPRLKQQVILMLQDIKLIPKLAKREGLVRLHGAENARLLKDLFLGSKQEKLNQYLRNLRKTITYSDVKRFDTFAAVRIKNIEALPSDYVYSLEVEDAATVVTSNGLVTHNCIPVDPVWLIDEGENKGVQMKFLKLAREINDGMPDYTVNLILDILNELGKPAKGSRIGILGLAYKKGIDDMRESPSLKVIELLDKKQAKLFIYDPYVNTEHEKERRVKSMEEVASKSDVLVLLTDHTEFKVSPQQLKAWGVEAIVDCKNFFGRKEVESAGLVYKGIGK